MAAIVGTVTLDPGPKSVLDISTGGGEEGRRRRGQMAKLMCVASLSPAVLVLRDFVLLRNGQWDVEAGSIGLSESSAPYRGRS